jgi:hypothetical protein
VRLGSGASLRLGSPFLRRVEPKYHIDLLATAPNVTQTPGPAALLKENVFARVFAFERARRRHEDLHPDVTCVYRNLHRSFTSVSSLHLGQISEQ